jgi:hypothetical protein
MLQILYGYKNRFAQSCERHGYTEETKAAFRGAAAYDLSALDKLSVPHNVLLSWLSACSASSGGESSFDDASWQDAGMSLS